MINKIETYQDIGKAIAVAAHKKDSSLVNWHYDWLRRAINLESEENRPKCRLAYMEAYKEEHASYDSSKPLYFR